MRARVMPLPVHHLPRSFIIFTLFWSVGDNLAADNLMNISGRRPAVPPLLRCLPTTPQGAVLSSSFLSAAVLFMSLSLPAFGAASYVPAIVLERSLFVRKAPPALCHGCCCCLARNILPYSRPTECRRCRPPAAPARTACRERNDGLYRVITYLVCKILEEVFIALLNSIVYGEQAAAGL
jgi:hypothetical protein